MTKRGASPGPLQSRNLRFDRRWQVPGVANVGQLFLQLVGESRDVASSQGPSADRHTKSVPARFSASVHSLAMGSSGRRSSTSSGSCPGRGRAKLRPSGGRCVRSKMRTGEIRTSCTSPGRPRVRCGSSQRVGLRRSGCRCRPAASAAQYLETGAPQHHQQRPRLGDAQWIGVGAQLVAFTALHVHTSLSLVQQRSTSAPTRSMRVTDTGPSNRG